MTIRGSTKVLGIIGDPVVQARSPQFMNAHIAERGDDAVLVPLRVPPRGLASAIAGLRAIDSFAGAIVTMPHKRAVVKLVDHLEPPAALVGAANVIRRNSDGSITGEILDGEGFLAGLREIGGEVTGKRMLLLGAGGAAAAIAFAAGRAGARSIALLNRTRARAQSLATCLDAANIDAGAVDDEYGDYDLVVNASSVGMSDGDPPPLDPGALRTGMIVSDIIVGTKRTALVAAARERGCVVQNGDAMLVGQIPLMATFILGEQS